MRASGQSTQQRHAQPRGGCGFARRAPDAEFDDQDEIVPAPEDPRVVALRMAVAELPDRERSVLLLTAIAGYPIHAVGRLLGISRARAWQLRERAIRRLRERLAA